MLNNTIGPWENHILFDTVKTEQKQSGENKLEMLGIYLEEPECTKGITKKKKDGI